MRQFWSHLLQWGLLLLLLLLEPFYGWTGAEDARSGSVSINWADCTACHHDVQTSLPSLADLRPPAGGRTARRDCLTCHVYSELNSLSSNGSHPLRPVADHLACTDCHIAVEHGPGEKPPLPQGDYHAQACYACHKQVEVQRHAFSSHNQQLACRDCHPAHGPHRAALPRDLIPQEYRNEIRSSFDWESGNRLCLDCHNAAALTLSQRGGFTQLNSQNYHELHLRRGEMLCVECHEAHGSTRPALLRRVLLDGGVMLFTQQPRGGNCTTTCHGVDHRGWAYINTDG